MPDELTSKVISVIAATQHMPVDQIQPESTFTELKIDSLDGINILFALENEFNISIPDEATQTFGAMTIREIADGIRKLIEQGGQQPREAVEA